jgi:hypothetical protein
LSIVVLLVTTILLTGCGSEDQQSSTREVDQAIRTYFLAINKQDFTEAQKYLAQAERNFLALSPTFVGYNTWKELANSGTIKEIQVTKIELQGDKAVAKFTIYYQSGSTCEMERRLHKENGTWIFDTRQLMLWTSPLGGGPELPDPCR